MVEGTASELLPFAGRPPDERFLASLAASFLDAAPSCLAYVDGGLRIRFVNDAYCETFATTPEIVLGTLVGGRLGAQARERLPSLVASALNGEMPTFDLAGESATGDIVQLRGYCLPHLDAGGFPIGALLMMEDVTAQRQRFESLSRRRQFLTALLDAAVDGIMTIDAAGTIQSINKACCSLFGYDAHELLGAPVEKLMPAPHAGKHDGYISGYMRSGRAKVIGVGREVLAQRKDGSVFPIQLSVGEVRFDDEVMFIGIARDVSDR